jgi:hypothetical protein
LAEYIEIKERYVNKTPKFLSANIQMQDLSKESQPQGVRHAAKQQKKHQRHQEQEQLLPPQVSPSFYPEHAVNLHMLAITS